MVPRALACLFLSLLLLPGVAGQASAAQQANAERQNLVTNGGAEELDANGDLAGWSIYVREGKATVKQTTEDKSEGRAAARLEIHEEGAVFDVRTGQAVVPRLPGNTRYLLTADVKCKTEPREEPGGYFSVGAGQLVKVGRLTDRPGWQKVSVEITVPANAAVTRLEFSGGSNQPQIFLIDNVRLELLADGNDVAEPNALEVGVKLDARVPMLVEKIVPTDVKLVRAFMHHPVDGRVDTRYASGEISECGGSSVATISYGAYNRTDGLHVTLCEGSFDALQIRGGWTGYLYADLGEEVLTRPGADLPPLCEIRPPSKVYRRLFEERVQAQRLSFFREKGNGEPLADMTVLRVRPNEAFRGAADTVTLALSEPAEPDETIREALEARFGPTPRAYRLGQAAAKTVLLAKDEFIHLITPPQDVSSGIAAISLQLNIAGAEPKSVLTVRVQDVLDPRRESMGVDFQVPGPGTYTVTLDTPDQVFLPAREQWKHTPRLDGPIAPPPVLWVSLAAETPMTINSAQVTLHRVPREKALVEAGAWRKFLLRGLFKTMSEPRPWTVLDGKAPLREQIKTDEFAKRYEMSLIELLQTAEIALLLLPEDDVVRQYHEWLYQNLDREKPAPAPGLPQIPGAPHWAVLTRENWRELNHIAQWWLDNRMAPSGEFGGGIADDTDLFQTWQCLPMIESSPLGERLKDAAAKLSQLCWDRLLEEGINKRTMDGLHAYEEGVNQLALCSWWFYGDPVHFERAMVSARSVIKLMVQTEDGRLHFPSNDVGIKQAREGYQKIGVTPGDANWAPVRFMLHPLYVVGLYNRNPLVLERFERWGTTWADYQKPGAYVGQVDIPTGQPTIVSKLPTAQAAGPVNEWLALYHITGDPKWQEPFKLLMDSGGYWGTTVDYGRMPHALVRWKEPYQQKMQERFNNREDGYAGFYLHKDRTLLTKWLSDSASWYGRFRYIHTAAEQKTDRVLTYNATTPISCYLGDAPNRNRWLNFTAVSYEKLRGEDFAALVWDAGPDVLRVALYNFREQPLEGVMRVWRLDHGRYQVRTGPDRDDNGVLDSPAQEQGLELQRYSQIALTLPPRQVTIVQIAQVERLDDIVERADLALSPIDTRLHDNGKLEVKVHNIGVRPARDVRVDLVRGGRVAESNVLAEIQAPVDLEPKIISLWFDSARAGDVVQVDPDGTIPEIAEHNNRLTL